MGNSTAITKAVSLLKSWGADVVIHPDATKNGRPYTFAPHAVIVHHTASPLTASEGTELGIVARGRPDVPGPLSQILIARDATIHIVSYGRANHGGAGGPWRDIPTDNANAYSVGIEVSNNGLGEPYSTAVRQATRLTVAALLIAMNRDATWAIGHKEWAPTRKIDPRYDMTAERRIYAEIIKAKTTPPTPPQATRTSYVVKAGDTLWSIAKRLGTTMAKLVGLNKLKDPDDLTPGQVLGVNGQIKHTVKLGQTLSYLAWKYNSSITAIAQANHLSDRDKIQAGQVLIIPVNPKVN